MKKAILIVSFGTTYTETRIKNITAIKNQVSMHHPNSNKKQKNTNYRHHLS